VVPGFENLIAWQRARAICAGIVPILRAAALAHDFALAQQLNAAAISVVANIAEGYLRRNRRQFAYFLRIAAGSNGETRACLYAALDREYVSVEHCSPLIEATNETGRLIQGLIERVSKPSRFDHPDRNPEAKTNTNTND
jgi:four helix bundle protein